MQADQLRDWRHGHDLSQAELAALLGVTPNTVARWERGELPIRHPELVLLALDSLGERLADPVHAARRDATGPERNLPAELNSFVGRQQELAELVLRLHEDARLLTLTGTGGIGKTRLALRLATNVVSEFTDGIWLVELAALRDNAQVPPAVAAVLRIREQPGRPIWASVADAIGARRLLLVFDNCEHVIDACAELVHSLLSTCAGLRVLATSREPLRVAGEMTWMLGGLSTPSQTQSAPDIEKSEAVQLFIERAKAVDSAFQLTAPNLQVVGQICQTLDGIPLAIELAAALLPTLAVGEILRRLDQRFDLLKSGPRTAHPRQQTLRAAVNWSYELLSEPDRRLLRQVSVFAGGWTLPAAEAVCDSPVSASEGGVEDALARLVSKSLVNHAQTALGESRYSLLETIRVYAREQLTQTDDESVVRRRHAEFFLTATETWGEAAGRGPDRTPWLDRLEQEHANTTEARRWTVRENDNTETRLRWAAALSALGYLRDYYAEAYAWNIALGAVPPAALPTLAWAKALVSTGVLALNGQIDFSVAVACFEAALPIARTWGDTVRVVRALVGLGVSLAFQGDFERGCAALEEAVATSRGSGDRVREAMALGTFGRIACARGDWLGARSLSQASLHIANEIGDIFTQSLCYRQLGDVARACDDLPAAGAYYELSLARAAEVGHRQATTYSLLGMGHVLLASNALDRASEFFTDSLALARRLGLRLEIAAGLEGIGCLAACLGRHADAVRLIGAATALREATGAPRPPGVEQLLEPVLRSTERALGEAAFGAVLEHAREVPLDTAFALAAAIDAAAQAIVAHRAPLALTPREHEVARLIGRGLTNKQIADELVVTQRTVAAHVEHILGKLGLRTRLQIGLWVVQQHT